MANYITSEVLKTTLSRFLSNLTSWLPIKGYTINGKSMANTLNTSTNGESALGYYNNSSQDTVVSMGIGSDESNRDNGFELKKDGSIYIKKDSNIIRLQDNLGSGEIEPIPVSDVESLK